MEDHIFKTNSPRLLELLKRALPSQFELINQVPNIVHEYETTYENDGKPCFVLVVRGDLNCMRVMDALVSNLRKQAYKRERLSLS